MTAPVVDTDTTKIPMPTVPEGYTVEFDADYEQIIGSDGTVYKPLQTKTVKGFTRSAMQTAQIKHSPQSLPLRFRDVIQMQKEPMQNRMSSRHCRSGMARPVIS